MLKLLIGWVKGGKTNTAMIAMIVVYILNKKFGIVTDETQIAGMLAVVLGSVGQIHKVWKSEFVQNLIADLKKEKTVEAQK